ncbi:hypothetical protein [Nonomuraea sp. NPDC049709]|uniref:hypothetical protein n=1 Tax=Nonomuraea sp. NPDC049709 TaxID=3154736 RepID=UPI0034311006
MDVGAGGGHGTRVIANSVAEAEIVAVEPSMTLRFAPGGRAVLNLQPPGAPVTVPESRFADVRIGRRRYEGWGRAEPVPSPIGHVELGMYVINGGDA